MHGCNYIFVFLGPDASEKIYDHHLGISVCRLCVSTTYLEFHTHKRVYIPIRACLCANPAFDPQYGKVIMLDMGVCYANQANLSGLATMNAYRKRPNATNSRYRENSAIEHFPEYNK
jgi:hypothetical protein